VPRLAADEGRFLMELRVHMVEHPSETGTRHHPWPEICLTLP
jgi:hypothetical protein